MHRLICAGAKGMLICRCSLSMSSAVFVMNLLKISLKDNEARKKKKKPLLNPGPIWGQCSYIRRKIANHFKAEISNIIMHDQYFVPNFVVYLLLITTAPLEFI